MTAELRFTNDWFTHSTFGKRQHKIESSKNIFEMFLQPVKEKCRNILEVGLCEGQSTLWMLEHLQPDKWVGIDPWKAGRRHHIESFKKSEANFWHNMHATGGTAGALLAAGNAPITFKHGPTACKVAKASSHDYLRGPIDKDFEDFTVDVYVVDGDHSSQGCLTDLVLGWRKLRPGGLILIDDFDRRWHQGRAHVHEGVLAFWMAFEHLCEKLFESRKHVVFRRKLDG